MIYPWEMPDAPKHVKVRQPVMELKGGVGCRNDLSKRRAPDELPQVLKNLDFGITIMTHRGSSNGRLSVLLSSIPSNYPVVVSSDSISEFDIEQDKKVCEHHSAEFHHCTPWCGRAKNAIHTMKIAKWDIVLFLNDDVWLFPEAVSSALRWFYTLRGFGVPLACLGFPGWETYREHSQWGFTSWQECLDKPWMFESVPPNPAYNRCPALYKNPFGACMMISQSAYQDLGGFTPLYWAEDDVFNHQIWLSRNWVSAAFPGRGYMHLGAQSWHHGETVDFVGEFKDATGMTPEESGKLQAEMMKVWATKIGHIFESLGGSRVV